MFTAMFVIIIKGTIGVGGLDGDGLSGQGNFIYNLPGRIYVSPISKGLIGFWVGFG